MKRITFFALFLLTFALPSGAQFARMYSSDNGLLSNQINCIFQDREGFIWFATQEGLSRFDGMEFESLRTEGVTAFCEDSYGTCWVGTAQGLFTLDKEKRKLEPFSLEPESSGEDAICISDILEVAAPDGTIEILACTSAQRLYIIDSKTYTINEDKQEALNAKLASKYVKKIYADSRNVLWIGSETGGLSVIDYKTRDLRNVCRWSSSLVDAAPSIVASAFAEDPVTGNIYIGTRKHGVLVYEDGFIRRARGNCPSKMNITSAIFNDIFPDGKNRSLILGTENSGFWTFNIDTESAQPVTIPGIQFTTENWKIHCLMKDSQGNMWAGAYLKGVIAAPKPMFGFDFDEVPCVTSIYKTPDEDFCWIGTDSRGIFKLDSDGKAVNYNGSNTGLAIDDVMTMTMDKHGKLWVGTGQDGLFSYSQGSGWKSCSGSGTPKMVKVISYDASSDRLYVGTAGEGLKILDASSGSLIATVNEESIRSVGALQIARDGTVWVGTGNGPMSYNPKNGLLSPYRLENMAKEMKVCAVAEGGDGTIWFGTGNGLVGTDRSTGEVVTVTEEDGLCCNSIKALQCADGYVWIATGNGLARYHTASGSIDNYYSNDGLQGNEFHTGASFRDSEGKLYFGGSSGVTSLYPHLVDRNVHEVPPVHLYGLTVNGKKQLKEFPDGSKIKLGRHSKMFSVSFAALEYTNPQKVHYSYILEGFEKEWHKADVTSRTATYTNVPHGKYRFAVRAYFDGNEEEFSQTVLNVKVKAPLFLTWWALLLYAALGYGVVITYLRAREARKKSVREKEISNLKEARLGMFTDLTHEIRTPLNLVMGPLKKMRENETNPLQKDTYNLMYRNCLRINRIVNQLMDLRKIDDGQMKLHFVETDIIDFIRDIMKSFSDLATGEGVDFDLISENLQEPLWIDQGNFDKIIFNLLSNAFKHTGENGTVQVTVSGPENGTVDISVYNSGSSIKESHLEKVFDRYYQDDPRDAANGSGVGLNLAKLLMDLHHGKIWAENRDGGVTFTLRLPTGCDHLTKEELSKTDHHKDLYTGTSTDGEAAKAPAAEPALPQNTKDEKITKPKDRNKFYNQVVKYIKEHIDDTSLSVETISEEMGMSRVHLNRKLKEAGAASPNALIKSIRLKQAAYLLVNNKVNVSDVASRVGFSTHSYFTRAFHDYFGMTPKEFVTLYQDEQKKDELARILE